MDLFEKGAGITLILLGIIFIWGGIHFALNFEPEPEAKIVDCYDKFGNKIVGIECLAEPLSEEQQIQEASLASIILIIIGVMMIIMGALRLVNSS